MLRIAFAQVYIRCALAEAVHLSLGRAFVSFGRDSSPYTGEPRFALNTPPPKIALHQRGDFR